METPKKHGQRSMTWPNEDTNGVLAKRFLKKRAVRQARRYVRRMAERES